MNKVRGYKGTEVVTLIHMSILQTLSQGLRMGVHGTLGVILGIPIMCMVNFLMICQYRK
jgi:hypothetical protein